MNKIAIITLVGDNYGNKFQNYAVETLFSQYGQVITYKLEDLYRLPESKEKSVISKLKPSYVRNVFRSRLSYRFDLKNTYHGLIHNMMYAQKHHADLLDLQKIRSMGFAEFSKQYLHVQEQPLNRNNTTKDWCNQFSFFVCGSDQIWNPTYKTTSELAFCSFAPERTVCISPSFGVAAIPECRKEEYAAHLKKISALSVREEAGRKIVKDLTNRDAEVLLDPTMLVPIEKWNAMCQQPKEKLPEHYIACYFLGFVDMAYKRKIGALAKELNMPVVMLFDITVPQYYTFHPAEVLYTIKHADYVLTDSFHGSVFSILFHKNFYVFERNEGGFSMSSRLETLLKRFGLVDRLFQNEKSKDITCKEWDSINLVLAYERAKARTYIEQAVRSCREKA